MSKNVEWQKITANKWEPKEGDVLEGTLIRYSVRDSNVTTDGVVRRYLQVAIQRKDGDGEIMLVSGETLKPLVAYKPPFTVKIKFLGKREAKQGKLNLYEIFVASATRLSRDEIFKQILESREDKTFDALFNEALMHEHDTPRHLTETEGAQHQLTSGDR